MSSCAICWNCSSCGVARRFASGIANETNTPRALVLLIISFSNTDALQSGERTRMWARHQQQSDRRHLIQDRPRLRLRLNGKSDCRFLCWSMLGLILQIGAAFVERSDDD